MARADAAVASDGCNAEAAEALHHCTVAAAALRCCKCSRATLPPLPCRWHSCGSDGWLRGGVKRKQKKRAASGPGAPR